MNEREELERELQAVQKELARREQLVSELEHQRARYQFDIQQYDQGSLVRSGDTRALVNAQLHRRTLINEVSAIELKLKEAREDLVRAKERIVIVQRELEVSARE